MLLAVLTATLATAASAQTPAPRAAPDTLTVATLNIWHDRNDWPTRLDLIVRDLQALRPDVLLLQEVLQREGLPNQAQTLADALGLPHVHFVSTDPPEAVHRYGNAIVSRHPFAETAGALLPPLDAYRTAALARLDVGGRPVRVVSTHLHNPPTPEGAGVRAMEIRHLLAFVDSTGGDAPLVLGGDFNATPDAPEMRMLDGFRDLGGAGVTYGPAYGAGVGRRIDYLFAAADPRLVAVEAGRALDRPDAQGRYPSDHFAVYARFVLP
ncbi:MAG: endonuclease/exonuclease/phosphatase family protein [Bacteroidota bacterium]